MLYHINCISESIKPWHDDQENHSYVVLLAINTVVCYNCNDNLKDRL